MKKFEKLCFAVIALTVSNISIAQNNILNAMSPEEIGDESIEWIYAKADGPSPYEYVTPRDMMFETMVWEVLPLAQKQNLVYYFPLEETNKRKPFFYILKEAIMAQKITKVYQDDDFKYPLN